MKPEDGEDFGNDFMDMPRIKALRRGIFIQRALMKFTACLNFQACRGNPASEYVIDETHPHYIAAPQKILGSYLKFRHRIKDLVVHGENNRFIDRHKIIAGKQAAIMALSPLRIKKYPAVTDDSLSEWRQTRGQGELFHPATLPPFEAPFVETMLLNAAFAFSLGVDILCTWNRLENRAQGFIECAGPFYSCYNRLLVNTFCHTGGEFSHDISFFWSSHLWYALEEKLKYWAKYGKLVP